jgi:hypothetical protein
MLLLFVLLLLLLLLLFLCGGLSRNATTSALLWLTATLRIAAPAAQRVSRRKVITRNAGRHALVPRGDDSFGLHKEYPRRRKAAKYHQCEIPAVRAVALPKDVCSNATSQPIITCDQRSNHFATTANAQAPRHVMLESKHVTCVCVYLWRARGPVARTQLLNTTRFERRWRVAKGTIRGLAPFRWRKYQANEKARAYMRGKVHSIPFEKEYWIPVPYVG